MAFIVIAILLRFFYSVARSRQVDRFYTINNTYLNRGVFLGIMICFLRIFTAWIPDTFRWWNTVGLPKNVPGWSTWIRVIFLFDTFNTVGILLFPYYMQNNLAEIQKAAGASNV